MVDAGFIVFICGILLGHLAQGIELRCDRLAERAFYAFDGGYDAPVALDYNMNFLSVHWFYLHALATSLMAPFSIRSIEATV